MKNIFMQKVFSLLVIASALSACSMKDRTESYQVNVQMPNSSSANSKYTRPAQASSSSTPAPGDIATSAALSGFRCFALNIVGSGIAADPRFGCSEASAGMGQMIGMADISGGSVAGDVLAGPARTIQLIGAKFDATSTIQGCPSFDSILSAAADPNHAFNGVNVYLLGQTTTDVFSDVSVPIVANFASTTSLFNDCSGNGSSNSTSTSNNTPQIGFDFFGPQSVSAVSLNQCVPFGIVANNITGAGLTAPPSDITLSWTSASGGTMTFSTDSQCTTGTPLTGMNNSLPVGTAVYPWNGQYLQLYMKAGGFTAPVNFSLSGFSAAFVTQPLQINMVSSVNILTPFANSLSLSTNTQLFTPNTACQRVDIRGFPGGSPVETANILLFNISGGAPTAKIYSYPGTAGDCSGADAIVAPTGSQYTGGNQNFYPSILLSANSSVNQSFWVKDTTSENLMIEVSDVNSAYQPTKFSMNFYQIGPAVANNTTFTTTGSGQVAGGEFVVTTGTDPGLTLQLHDVNLYPLHASIGAMSCSVSGGGTLGSVLDLSNGTYSIPFTPGTVNGTITCNVNGSPVSVTAQVLSQVYSSINFPATSLTSGTTTLVTIFPRDSNNNPINNPNLIVTLSYSGTLSSQCFSASSPQASYQADGTYQLPLEFIPNGGCSSGTTFTGGVQPVFNGVTFSASQTLSVGP